MPNLSLSSFGAILHIVVFSEYLVRGDHQEDAMACEQVGSHESFFSHFVYDLMQMLHQLGLVMKKGSLCFPTLFGQREEPGTDVEGQAMKGSSFTEGVYSLVNNDKSLPLRRKDL